MDPMTIQLLASLGSTAIQTAATPSAYMLANWLVPNRQDRYNPNSYIDYYKTFHGGTSPEMQKQINEVSKSIAEQYAKARQAVIQDQAARGMVRSASGAKQVADLNESQANATANYIANMLYNTRMADLQRASALSEQKAALNYNEDVKKRQDIVNMITGMAGGAATGAESIANILTTSQQVKTPDPITMLYSALANPEAYLKDQDLNATSADMSRYDMLLAQALKSGKVLEAKNVLVNYYGFDETTAITLLALYGYKLEKETPNGRK